MWFCCNEGSTEDCRNLSTKSVPGTGEIFETGNGGEGGGGTQVGKFGGGAPNDVGNDVIGPRVGASGGRSGIKGGALFPTLCLWRLLVIGS